MGIPKFFRWISERYPMCSKFISQNKIPEFDNMYLDMNGIIHNCSHNSNNSNNSNNNSISEQEIWTAIFSYVDHLVAKIKPKKIIFMAVDGVAPRAKANQQRSRRFRTAQEAMVNLAKALGKGEELPEDSGFDSNCITPGTEFMTKLTLQLRYFIALKVSMDANWRGVKVILSGSEVPGEGEHKIMDYIRVAKAQPDYDPNTRHCLYGLDADLIILGLATHDPHFALLREEVSFGTQAGKKKKLKRNSLESQNFFLMHLTLLREYLDLEFGHLKDYMHFPYDLERIIDDFILLTLFIGNDFIPILPGLQTQDGPLGIVFEIYKIYLRTSGGYLQDASIVNFKCLQKIIEALGDTIEKKHFEDEHSHLLSAFQEIEEFLTEHSPSDPNRLYFSSDLNRRDRKVIENIANDLGLYCDTERSPGTNKTRLYIDYYLTEDWEEEDPPVCREEIGYCIQEKYETAMKQWKRSYYKEKMNINVNNKQAMDAICQDYATGIQWVLGYYYNGVPSWGWFYPYHYAPKITDLVNLERFQGIKFDLGKPFRPYEQLLAVLPAPSKNLLPLAYQELMVSPISPIRDFYPIEIETDLNGKRYSWEAVIKVPFVDAGRLLDAVKLYEDRLTVEEQRRAEFGNCYKFEYDPEGCADQYTSPLPGAFPDIRPCLATEVAFHLPALQDGLSHNKGLLKGVKEALPGFPSLKSIPHTANISFHSANIFQQESKNDTMVVTLINQFKSCSLKEITEALLGECVHVDYPNLQEAIVVGVSDQHMKYYIKDHEKNKDIRKHLMRSDEKEDWRKRIERVEYTSSLQSGLMVGKTKIGVHVCTLQGMTKTENGSYKKKYANMDQEDLVPLQTIVPQVAQPDARYVERPPLPMDEEFPVGTKAFFLGSTLYGHLVTIVSHGKHETANIQDITPAKYRTLLEPSFGHAIARSQENNIQYTAANNITRSLKISSLALSKITSSVLVQTHGTQRINLGLNLKFEAKKLKVVGYTRKNPDNKWEYSRKAIDLIEDYVNEFPEFVELVNSKKGGGMLHMDDFYWTDSGPKEIDRMRQWLKDKKVDELSSASFRTEELEEYFVKRVVEEAKRYQKEHENLVSRKKVVQDVRRSMLLNPADAGAKLQTGTFTLGDRAIYALDTGPVRLGARGTVVGVREDTIDVVFDTIFIGANTLDNKCPDPRGLSLPFSSMLNLSDRAFVAHPCQTQQPAPSLVCLP